MSYTPEQDLNHNLVAADHRYSCHQKQWKAEQVYELQNGWSADGRKLTYTHTTRWIPMKCGHTYRKTDPNCSGCYRR